MGEFVNLQYLSISGIGLSSLEHFPHLPHLQKLNLSHNSISKGLHHLEKADLLSIIALDLSFNPLNKLAEIEYLSSMERMINLNFQSCPVTRTPDYRLNVSSILPFVKFLDQFDVNGKPGIISMVIPRDEVKEVGNNITPSKRLRTGPPPQHGKLYLSTEYASIASLLSNINVPQAEAINVSDDSSDQLDETLLDSPSTIKIANGTPSAPQGSDTEDSVVDNVPAILRMMGVSCPENDDDDDEDFHPGEVEDSGQETEDDEEEEQENEDREEDDDDEEQREHSPKRRRESTSTTDGEHKRRK